MVVGGTLNPMWVEWLMGWPVGWTDCEPLELAEIERLEMVPLDEMVREVRP